ncbi:MAG: YbhB/YbcL family Raf kinase inhibitor-like protein [Planctomycetota bacterium]
MQGRARALPRTPLLSTLPLVAALLLVVLLGGCDRPGDSAAMTPPGQAPTPRKEGSPMQELSIESTAFSHDGTIPRRHSGEGEDLSPALRWSGVPEGTRELALIVDDPDAPTARPWVHWVLYKLAPETRELAEGVPPVEQVADLSGALQGTNSWGRVGYGGPMPPPGHGVHHYRFHLYALDMPLSIGAGVAKQALLDAMAGHVIAEGELVGRYKR